MSQTETEREREREKTDRDKEKRLASLKIIFILIPTEKKGILEISFFYRAK